MSKIKETLEGWSNYLKDDFNLLDERTKKLSAKRLLIYNTCDMSSGNVCDKSKGGCGCLITQKSFSKDSHCPIGKW